MSNYRGFLLSLLLCCLSLGASAAPLDLNTADAQALSATMTAVGPHKAQAIVEYRDAHGPFKSVDDLLKVQGIGQHTLDQNRDLVTVIVPPAKRK